MYFGNITRPNSGSRPIQFTTGAPQCFIINSGTQIRKKTRILRWEASQSRRPRTNDNAASTARMTGPSPKYPNNPDPPANAEIIGVPNLPKMRGTKNSNTPRGSETEMIPGGLPGI